MRIDLSKPVQTRDGRAARIVSEKGPGAFPILAIISYPDGTENMHRYTLAGNAMFVPGETEDDLVNVPLKTHPRTVYVNLGLAHGSFAAAKKDANYDWEVIKVDLDVTDRGIQPGGVHAIRNVEVVDA